ncbi:hypothetical protein PsorP6_013233 [Peronosclerospora sorghi]|uniref:Uncharacterized protein n=1 Tax=Peronosclerospora sorghi TaxID=230839 RepID=A0ACC0WH13_9STRA|nr:hypothetical protein PsorP6_013233 [Peronosclerospora sorghi]
MMAMGMTPQQIAGATGGDTGKVYAMEVIKKAAVFLPKIKWNTPRQSIAFFRAGGTLHFHLRRSAQFDEVRTRFYAAQLVLALSHLHTYNIVYRDLKPENILLDDQGFLALRLWSLA